MARQFAQVVLKSDDELVGEGEAQFALPLLGHRLALLVLGDLRHPRLHQNVPQTLLELLTLPLHRHHSRFAAGHLLPRLLALIHQQDLLLPQTHSQLSHLLSQTPVLGLQRLVGPSQLGALALPQLHLSPQQHQLVLHHLQPTLLDLEVG